MKIENSGSKPTSAVSGDTKTRASREAPTAAPSASPQGSAKVQISSLSSGLQQIEKLIASTPVVDEARVSEIKQAISEGRFTVHSEKVADGLIESVRQMLSAQPRAA